MAAKTKDAKPTPTAEVPAPRKRAARAKPEPTAAEIFEGARAALETSLKDLGLADDVVAHETAALAEKCGYDSYVTAYIPPPPYGGATSFGEIDSYRQSLELDMHVAEVTSEFQAIVSNVLGNEALSMSEKSSRISAAAAEMQSRVEAGPDEGDEVFIGEMDAKPIVGSTPAAGTSFKAFKDGDVWHWFAIFSNTGWDKGSKAHPKGERFTEAAHKDFVDWVWGDPNRRMPELWDWHTPVGVGTYRDGRKGMGRADWVDYADGVATAAGHFYPEFNYAAEALAGVKELGVSHGYEYEKSWLKPSGEYVQYRSFEISPLPRERAANELTLFMPELAEKESPMFNPVRRPHLVAIHGEARVKAMEDALAPVAAAMKAAGKEVDFKDFEAALATEAPTPTTPAASAATVPGASGVGAPLPEQAAKDALTTVINAAFKDNLAPIEARLTALEAREVNVKELVDQAVATAFGPRYTPDPSRAPSESPNNVVNGNNGAVRAAVAGQKDAPVEGIPEHLQWYFKNGAAAMLGGSFDMMGAGDPSAAIAAMGNQPAAAAVA